ncbi:3-hydroxybutyryl-CoA dehydrogenase [Kibdelosporangium banguiense]|uniref:3-hydroxybutyryl-CoA dehydrogenase n=1 Tax=Kibdelosporangium banguiense TaxID=1365924 RepID=A0ABS4TTG5_9PSEU|nr:3-hydroxybutyryl-CoA dehydrogenase [Kibdelosporangium banguiense]MBP2327690.1 3-hydroxybutyryl-CoA dehydrogenase [Kibdelosporangium banguiense]
MVERVGVVGCGTMGAGIAEICARAHLSVKVAVSGRDSEHCGRRRLAASLDRAMTKGRITGFDRDDALSRIIFVHTIDDLADRQLVIESVTEDEQAKLHLFKDLDRVMAAPDAVLASNTSSIPIIRLAAATSRPENVIGIHFFNPVTALPLTELIASLSTSDKTRAAAEHFAASQLGKQVVWSPDRAGFTVNALLIPYILGAIRMVESGFTSAEAVDRAMTLGCNHPMGPLQLADLIGLDVVTSIAEAMYQEYKEPLYAPPPLLLRMVEAGALGRKAGRGFHAA